MRYSTYKFVKDRCWILGFLNIHFDFISKLDFDSDLFWRIPTRWWSEDSRSSPVPVRWRSVYFRSNLIRLLPVSKWQSPNIFRLAWTKLLGQVVLKLFSCFWIFHFFENFWDQVSRDHWGRDSWGPFFKKMPDPKMHHFCIKNKTYFSFFNRIQISDSVFRRQTLFSVL